SLNHGDYNTATSDSTEAPVITFASRGMEQRAEGGKRIEDHILGMPAPDPQRALQHVANDAAHAIDFYTPRLGPFPFRNLSVTQMPGRISQGWPGLIFLSSFAFVPEQDGEGDSYAHILYDRLMLAHETAHQWWGDRVMWQ